MGLDSKLNLYIYLAIIVAFLAAICVFIQILVIKKLLEIDRNIVIANKNEKPEEDNLDAIKTPLETGKVENTPQILADLDLESLKNGTQLAGSNHPIIAGLKKAKTGSQLDRPLNDLSTEKPAKIKPKLADRVTDPLSVEPPKETIPLAGRVTDPLSVELPKETIPLDGRVTDPLSVEPPKETIPLDGRVTDPLSVEPTKETIPLDDHVIDELSVEMTKEITPLKDHVIDQLSVESPKKIYKFAYYMMDEQPVNMSQEETSLDDRVTDELSVESPKKIYKFAYYMMDESPVNEAKETTPLNDPVIVEPAVNETKETSPLLNDHVIDEPVVNETKETSPLLNDHVIDEPHEDIFPLGDHVTKAAAIEKLIVSHQPDDAMSDALAVENEKTDLDNQMYETLKNASKYINKIIDVVKKPIEKISREPSSTRQIVESLDDKNQVDSGSKVPSSTRQIAKSLDDENQVDSVTKVQSSPGDVDDYSHLIIKPIVLNTKSKHEKKSLDLPEKAMLDNQTQHTALASEASLAEPKDDKTNLSYPLFEYSDEIQLNEEVYIKNDINLDEVDSLIEKSKETSILDGNKELDSKKILDTYQQISDMYK